MMVHETSIQHNITLIYTFILAYLPFIAYGISTISICTFLLPSVYRLFLYPQNLKRKYNASWAIVTGGSSGIGKALVGKLLSQGLNVFIVAIDDQLLAETTKEYQKKYPKQQTIAIPTNLGKPGYMEKINEYTQGKDVQLVFCNAGFMMTGFYTSKPMAAHLINYNCNVTCHIELAHEYVKRMQESNLSGCVVFTGSPAGFLPSPFSVLYGSTKAFLTEFAASLSCEVRSDNIDVSIVHPSPVTTRFYDKADKIDEIKFFMKTGTTPETLANALLSAPGKLVIYNQGYYPFVAKFMLMLTDRAFLTEIMARIAHTLPSYKVIKENIQRNDSTKMSSSSKKKNNRAKSVSRRRKKKN